MTADGTTSQARVLGSIVDGDAHLHVGERQGAAIPPLEHSALKARGDEILNRRLTAEKRPASRNPGRLATSAIGALAGVA